MKNSSKGRAIILHYVFIDKEPEKFLWDYFAKYTLDIAIKRLDKNIKIEYNNV